MPANREVALIFMRIGDLMDYREENSFKVRSYWRAAEVLFGLPEPLSDVAARGALESLPGVGEAIAGKIHEILATGTCSLYERLKSETPANVQALLRLPTLTARQVRILVKERGLSAPEDLSEIVADGLEEIPNLTAGDRAQIVRAAMDCGADG